MCWRGFLRVGTAASQQVCLHQPLERCESYPSCFGLFNRLLLNRLACVKSNEEEEADPGLGNSSIYHHPAGQHTGIRTLH